VPNIRDGVSLTFLDCLGNLFSIAPNNFGNYCVREIIDYGSGTAELVGLCIDGNCPTPTPTPTQTETPTPTETPTQTITQTQTVTQTSTPTVTQTSTPTVTITESVTQTQTPTPTETPTNTLTPTVTITESVTPTRTLTPTKTQAPCLDSCDVLLLDNVGRVYVYNPVTNLPIYLGIDTVDGSFDIAHTNNKLWINNGTSLFEWDIILCPFSATFNRQISGSTAFSAGLFAINDTTLIANGATTPSNIFEIDVSTNPYTVTTKFPLLPGRRVSGDYVLTNSGKLIVSNFSGPSSSPTGVYITQYNYITSATPPVDNNIDILISPTITFPYGLYQYGGSFYILNFNGVQ